MREKCNQEKGTYLVLPQKPPVVGGAHRHSGEGLRVGALFTSLENLTNNVSAGSLFSLINS